MSGDLRDEGVPASPGRGACVLAIDVGGTDLKAAVLSPNGILGEVRRRPTPRTTQDPGDAIVNAVADLTRETSSLGASIDALGVAIPGLVDEGLGIGIRSGNLGWTEYPFRDRISDVTGLDVALVHDVRAAGDAEHRLGGARGARDAAIVTIGTGIAAALILDGRPYRGGGYAGELGHLVVDRLGPECRCGRRGCLEAIASARAIVDAYRASAGRSPKGAEEVVALAAGGDAVASGVWERALDALAVGLEHLSALMAPEVILIGGGLSEAGDRLLDPLRKRMAGRVSSGRPTRIQRATLGQNAGVWGAALAARDIASAGLAP